MRDWLAFYLFERWWTPDAVHYWAYRRILRMGEP